jgi:hypothetical protein
MKSAKIADMRIYHNIFMTLKTFDKLEVSPILNKIGEPQHVVLRIHLKKH